MICPSSRTVCRRGSTRVPRSRISSPSTDTLLDRIYSSQCRREPMPAAARNFCRRTRTCRGSPMGDTDDFETECFMATKIMRIHEKRSVEFTLWRKLPENNRTELKQGRQVQSQILANQSPPGGNPWVPASRRPPVLLQEQSIFSAPIWKRFLKTHWLIVCRKKG